MERKIDFENLDYFKMGKIEKESEDEELYTLVAYSKAMKRNTRLVIWKNEKGEHKLYFSTDVDMSGIEVIEYYRTRFQIEFCYRDAKQYTGCITLRQGMKENLTSHSVLHLQQSMRQR